MEMYKSINKMCVNAMGIAMFVVLSYCIQVPVFENYYLCLGYVAMTVFCYYYGPISGMTVGGFGVVFCLFGVLLCFWVLGLGCCVGGVFFCFVWGVVWGVVVGFVCVMTAL